ncbi:MAG: gliding motility lipoprotein GldH [Saprospiraceae bacterium]
MFRHYLLFCITAFILLGCNNDIVYDKKVVFDEAWTYNDVQEFTFDIIDTIPAHDILLEVIHDKHFAFQNIYTKVTTIFPDQQKVEHQVSLQLTDALNVWVGDCDSKNCTASLVLSENIYFNQTGKYIILLEQYGRTDSLKGMMGFHFKVIHSKK